MSKPFAVTVTWELLKTNQCIMRVPTGTPLLSMLKNVVIVPGCVALTLLVVSKAYVL